MWIWSVGETDRKEVHSSWGKGRGKEKGRREGTGDDEGGREGKERRPREECAAAARPGIYVSGGASAWHAWHGDPRQ